MHPSIHACVCVGEKGVAGCSLSRPWIDRSVDGLPVSTHEDRWWDAEVSHLLLNARREGRAMQEEEGEGARGRKRRKGEEREKVKGEEG